MTEWTGVAVANLQMQISMEPVNIIFDFQVVLLTASDHNASGCHVTDRPIRATSGSHLDCL